MNFSKKMAIFILTACFASIPALAGERELPLGDREPVRDLKAAAAPVGGHFGAPVVIAAEPNTTYNEKTTIKFHPSGAVYILFNAVNDELKKHYVDLYKFDGVQSIFVKHVSETDLRAYECDMDISSDGFIHCAWVEAANPNALTHYIRYRVFDGINWGPVETLRTLTIDGEVGGHNLEKVDDMRIAADNDGNIFIGYMLWPAGRCQTISRFGKTVYNDPFPFVGRSKHVCVDADDKYVHLTWLGMEGVYGIYYARRNKTPNSPWSTVIKVYQPPNYPPDRPYIQIATNDDVPQLVYLHNVEGGGREMHHRTFRNNKWSEVYTASTGLIGTFHQPRMAAMDNDNVLIQTQIWAGGARTYYNWKKNGVWSGLIQYNQVKAVQVYGDVDLNPYGVGAMDFTDGGSVQLTTSGPLTINDLPTAVITLDKETIFWGETVNMNSAGSVDPDGTIVGYEWKIVQDNVVIPGATASYTFNKSYNNVKIRLTAIDDKGGRGVAEKIVTVNALYTAPSTATKKNIQTLIFNKEGYVIEWTPNPKNEEAGYNIVKYKVSRKAVDSAEWVELAELGGDRRAYADVTIDAGTEYIYAVSAVDDQGRMSPYDNY